jgi:hypothetical protein
MRKPLLEGCKLSRCETVNLNAKRSIRPSVDDRGCKFQGGRQHPALIRLRRGFANALRVDDVRFDGHKVKKIGGGWRSTQALPRHGPALAGLLCAGLQDVLVSALRRQCRGWIGASLASTGSASVAATTPGAT